LLLLSRQVPAEIILRSSQQLPELLNFDVSTAGGYARVSNRLKVMANVIPMRHRTSVSGEFHFWVNGSGFVAHVEFHDEALDPWLQIRCKMSTLPSPNPRHHARTHRAE